MNMPENTIIIDTWSSKCQACGRNAFPDEGKHDSVGGWGGSTPGCGIVWKYATSNYTNMRESVERQWPQYIWIGTW